MRFSTDLLGGVLTGAHDHYWSADLIYDGDTRLTNVPLTDVQFSEDADAKVQQTGSCTIVWTDVFGKAMAPRTISAAFAPFGAQLRVYSNVSAGPFTERVQYGVFEITDVPSAHDEDMEFRGLVVSTGSVIELELSELLAGVGQETFAVPTSPSQLLSVWDEAAVVSGLQIERSVDDALISRSIMYPESKLDALYELFDVILDSVPHMRPDGVLAARPAQWPAPVHTVRRGPGGQVVRVMSAMSAADVYNRVVVRATSDDQKPVLAFAEIESGPLRVRNPDGSRSPYRARTLYQSSEFVTTTVQAQAWADSTLAQVATLRTQVVPVTMTFDPRVERGDVLVIRRLRGDMTVRVKSIDRSGRGTQSLTVEVGE
jgi:hypothetical protein